MNHYVHRITLVLGLVLCAGWVHAQVAPFSQFKGQQTITFGSLIFQSDVFVDGPRVRLDTSITGGRTSKRIVILRFDENVGYALEEERKEATRFALDEPMAGWILLPESVMAAALTQGNAFGEKLFWDLNSSGNDPSCRVRQASWGKSTVVACIETASALPIRLELFMPGGDSRRPIQAFWHNVTTYVPPAELFDIPKGYLVKRL